MVKDDDGPRHVAVAIVHSPSTNRILMITSRAHPDLWLLPKGGIEHGESSGQAAVRESWEEAGTPRTLRAPRDDERLMMLSLPSKKKEKGAVWHVHAIEVDESEVEQIREWPEAHQRKRAWFTPAESLSKINQWYTDHSPLDEAERHAAAVPDDRGESNNAGDLDTGPADSSKKKQKQRDKAAKKGGAMEMAVKHFAQLRELQL
ncbi:hypothetical protein IAU60_002081 [Kwoniella sp. DSM 27419]